MSTKWVATGLKDIDEAQEFIQDIGAYPERLEVKGFLAFKAWMGDQCWVTFAQPLSRRVVAYTPRNYQVAEGLKTWVSPYKHEEA